MPKVTSVTAINAKTVQVTFNSAIKADTVIQDDNNTPSDMTDNTLVNGAMSFTSLDSKVVNIDSANAVLSADGKTLTLKAQTTEYFSGRYDVKVPASTIKTTAGDAVEKYEATITIKDTAAPTITSTEKFSASVFKVHFSEPIASLGTDTYALSTGTALATVDGGATNGVRVDFTAGNDYVTLTLGSDIGANKSVVATFAGTKDYAGVLISPNPATTTFTKGDKDGVAPEVSSIKAINNKTLEVKFSEELIAAPTVTNFAGTLTYTKDTTDKTKYTVKSDTANTGLKQIGVSAGYTDLSGETGLAATRLINFDLDTVGPTLVSAVVEKGTDNLEYLVLTFNEDVVAGSTLANITLTGTATKDYVTTSTLPVTTIAANKLVVDTTNAKIARIKLVDLVGSTNNATTLYDLTLRGATIAPADCAIVDDISGNAGSVTLKAKFTRGTDGTASNTSQAQVKTGYLSDGTTASASENGIFVVDNNTLQVMFKPSVDGATAVNTANYTVDGAVVESATLAAADANKQMVTLKLKANSNTFTGERNVTVSGVKANAGLVMDTYNTTESLYENVAPTVTKAVLTDVDTITVTFSENVVNAAAATGDFDLYIGGIKVANTVTTALQTTGAKTIVLTLGTDLTIDNINAGLTIKATDAININDGIGSGNIVSAPTAITVIQE